MAGSSFGQAFQSTFATEKIDFNHYSIESMGKGGKAYFCAGTLFDAASGNNDIHVFALDLNGNMIWERIIDHSKDDRALDICFDGKKNLVVTGYILSKKTGTKDLYVAQFDIGGTFITDHALTSFQSGVSAGTNVIYSQSKDEYIVGGFYADAMDSYPLGGNKAITVRFDNSLNYLDHIQISQELDGHSSINDIVEIKGKGYYLTGSIGLKYGAPNYATQGVLSMFVDFNLGLQTDLSFESTNSEHVGVSAIYSNFEDRVYLMSNNSIIHNPQISIIEDVMGSPVPTSNYYLELDPNYGSSNAAGFELKQSLSDPRLLVACGYFRTFTDGITSNNAIPWITEFEKESGGMVHYQHWPASSPNFHAHGGGVFSTFSGEHPYIFNQEILTERCDVDGYAFIGAREVGSNFGIDIVTTNLGWEMPCFKRDKYKELKIKSVKIVDTKITYDPIKYYNPKLDPKETKTKRFIYCDEIVDSPMILDQRVDEFSNADKMNEDRLTDIKTIPNPFNESINVVLNQKNEGGYFTIRNTLGQIVYQSQDFDHEIYQINIDGSEFKTGIYILNFTNNNGEQFTQKIVKK